MNTRMVLLRSMASSPLWGALLGSRVLVISAMLLTAPGLATASDIHAELLKDIVVIHDGKFTATDLTLLKLPDGITTYQIKAYAEAPAQGVISRDNFVAVFTYMTLSMIDEITGDVDVEVDDLDELIGNPDIEINMYMQKAGLQMEVVDGNGARRFTQKWTDLK